MEPLARAGVNETLTIGAGIPANMVSWGVRELASLPGWWPVLFVGEGPHADVTGIARRAPA
jgi:hypothetical protein